MSIFISLCLSPILFFYFYFKVFFFNFTFFDTHIRNKRAKGCYSREPRGATLEPRGATLKPRGATLEPRGATQEPSGATLSPIIIGVLYLYANKCF